MIEAEHISWHGIDLDEQLPATSSFWPTVLFRARLY